MDDAKYYYVYGFNFNDTFVPLFYHTKREDYGSILSKHPFYQYESEINKKKIVSPSYIYLKCIPATLIDGHIYMFQIKYKINTKRSKTIYRKIDTLNEEDLNLKSDFATYKRIFGEYLDNYAIVSSMLSKIPSKEIFLKRLEAGAAS